MSDAKLDELERRLSEAIIGASVALGVEAACYVDIVVNGQPRYAERGKSLLDTETRLREAWTEYRIAQARARTPSPDIAPREEPPSNPECPTCHGASVKHHEGFVCLDCSAYFEVPAPAPSRAQAPACPYCKPGRPCYADTPNPDPSKRCPECKGRGWHPGDCHPREECAKREGTGWAAAPSGPREGT